MPRKSINNTKVKIVDAAWKLFYEQGYDDTTIDDIVSESNTSKGTFYHYFQSKDSLLGTLSILFDEKYEEILPNIDPNMNSFDKLMFLNQALFGTIEDRISLDLITQLYSYQLLNKTKELLDHNRTYYKVLRQIILEGQSRGEISNKHTVNEISKLYALCERALIYDWCLCSGEYSLRSYSKDTLPLMLGYLRG